MRCVSLTEGLGLSIFVPCSHPTHVGPFVFDPELVSLEFYHDLKCSFCKAVRFALLASLSYICLLYSSILCWIYPPTSGVWQHCRSRVWEQNCCCFNFNLPGRPATHAAVSCKGPLVHRTVPCFRRSFSEFYVHFISIPESPAAEGFEWL